MGELFKSPFEVVMIIDDTEADMYITNRILVKHNFAKKVLQFSMADDALEYLRENDTNSLELPQVIFVDIHMPKKTGFEKSMQGVSYLFVYSRKRYCTVAAG